MRGTLLSRCEVRGTRIGNHEGLSLVTGELSLQFKLIAYSELEDAVTRVDAVDDVAKSPVVTRFQYHVVSLK